MKNLFLLLILTIFGLFLFAQDADALVGTYTKGDGNSKSEFFKSGNSYSGKIVWLKEPNDENGKPKKDVKNPDKELRSRPVIGLVNMTGLTYVGDGKYINGKAYRPTDGNTADLSIKVNGDGTISVTGSKYGISRTATWKKQ